MIKACALAFCLLTALLSHAQDTTIMVDKAMLTLPDVLIRSHFDYNTLLQRIKDDSSFYKAFRNLRVIGFSAYNDIKMLDKKGQVKASLYSKTVQHRDSGCRTMQVLDEQTTGDFYDNKHHYNYMTAELYASLFFTKGKVCGENNIVAGHQFTTSNKKGTDKHKEQLKMLFFNPGKKIDLYDEDARKLYNYKLDLQQRNGQMCYVFAIEPKDNLGFFKSDRIVIDKMVTWFDEKTLEVVYRSYSLSYKAGVYDFDVNMEVEMTRLGNLTVPKTLRYNGNWDVVFKKRERAVFTATLFNYSITQ
jgi:hypothetical protein